MKTTLVGGIAVPELRVLLTKAELTPEIHVHNGWIGWAAVEDVAPLLALGVTLTALTVDDEGKAARLEMPSGAVADLTAEAGAIEATAHDAVALALAEQVSKQVDIAHPKDVHVRWAESFIAKLVVDNSVELKTKSWPLGRIVKLLDRYAAKGPLDAKFGEAVMDLLVDDKSVEEVFADEEALNAAARATRP